MKTIISKSKLLLSIILVYAATAFSQSQDKVKASLMKMDNKYYIQLTENDVPVSNAKYDAVVKLVDANGNKSKVKATAFGKNAFVLNSNVDGFKTLTLKIHRIDNENKKNISINSKFVNTASPETVYVCTMHPDEFNKSNGLCPHCNMALKATTVNVFINDFPKGNR